MASRIRSVAEFGKEYYALEIEPRLAQKTRLATNWWCGLRFWFDRCFYQGRSDAVSRVIEDHALKALARLLGQDMPTRSRVLDELGTQGWLDRQCYEHEANRIQGVLLEEQVNKRYDRLMVIGSLALTRDTGPAGIVGWAERSVREGALRTVHRRLDDLPSVGDKIASLFLRDVVDLFDLRECVAMRDAPMLQPVDTWVRQIAVKLDLVPEEATPVETKEAIVRECHSAGADPIRFNQGAWYLAWRALDILLERL